MFRPSLFKVAEKGNLAKVQDKITRGKDLNRLDKV